MKNIRPAFHFDSRFKPKGFLALPGSERFINSDFYPIVPFSRKALAEYAKLYYKNPSAFLTVIGITGTNGKSSVVHYLNQLLVKLNRSVLSIGTLTHTLTTPESLSLQEEMAYHLEKKGDTVVMEVSSHGIHQGRILGINFDIKCLTNISQDHLDYHTNFEHYQNTKHYFMNNYPGKSIFPNDFLNYKLEEKIVPNFQHQNIQACCYILEQLGYQKSKFISLLKNLKPPPGRFEFVKVGQQYDVVVDYAHTPEALESVLITAKELSNTKKAKLIVVFGCGGNRDKNKRPKMGEIAQSCADLCIITSDNPRNESPQNIINDILRGMDLNANIIVKIEREDAIQTACRLAKKNDVIVIAGKGHEKKQLIQNKALAFCDVSIAKKSILDNGL